jgi:hypothetical protein
MSDAGVTAWHTQMLRQIIADFLTAFLIGMKSKGSDGLHPVLPI